MDRDQIICVCQDVTAGEILDAIRRYRSLDEVKRRTCACVTCFGCEMELEELFEEYAAEVAASRRNEERGMRNEMDAPRSGLIPRSSFLVP